MSKLFVFITLLGFICVVYGSTGYIENAKGEDCSSGTCHEVCSYDGLNLIPVTEETDDGKCRRVRCNQDFSVDITQ